MNSFDMAKRHACSLCDRAFDHKYDLKGVLHPRLVFGLFLHFSQKLQHIGNK